jgi:hypothetical protein
MGNRYDKNMSVPPARDSWSRNKCPTPDALDKILNSGKSRPSMDADPRQQLPQDAIDQRGKRYDNDCKGWLRSQGENSTRNRPGGFDSGPSGHRYSGKRG